MDDEQRLRLSPLDDLHREAGARMVPFAGWSMPIQYSGIIEEHQTVRQAAGVFDVSHMMRAGIRGPQAALALRGILTYDVTTLEPGRGHYTLMCNEDGGILDDPYVYRTDEKTFLFVGNAANAERDWQAVSDATGDFEASATLYTEETVMIAVQGPAAVELCGRVVGESLGTIKRRRCEVVPWQGGDVFASRTGYTGEDGFEFVCLAEVGRSLWSALLKAGAKPAGLGARDTLRLEAALALYGNDIDESTNPYEARLDWVVSLDDGATFRGREALLEASQKDPATLLCCLQASERGVPRAGCPIFVRDSEQGRVTSGGFSPTLQTGIAMAYLQNHLAGQGTRVQIDVRGRPLPAVVVNRPFYRGTSRKMA